MTTAAPRAQPGLTIEERIERNTEKRQRAETRHEASLAKIDAERRRIVQRGFDEGYSGRQLADLLGLSIPRVYQIRDGR